MAGTGMSAERIIKELSRLGTAGYTATMLKHGAVTDKAVAAAKRIGDVSVDMGGTACKVPSAAEYIGKVAKAGRVGRKRGTVRGGGGGLRAGF